MTTSPNIKASERFREELTAYLDAFVEELAKQYSKPTVNKYEDVIGYHSLD